MGPDPSAPDGPEAGRLNTRLALLMFCAVAAPCLVLSAMANDARVQDAIHRVCWTESIWKKQIPIYCFYDHYLDSDDKLVHEELPAADFSRGSVCLLGASSMNWALNLWDLPESTRRLIHNFAMRGTNHADHLDLIRYLVETEGLLRAGGEKTLVVFGLSYHMTHNARLSGKGPAHYFNSLWTRRGLYSVDPDGSIHRSPLHPLLVRIVLERAKITGLLRELVNLAYTPFKGVRVLGTPESTRQAWAETLGPRWEEKIRCDVAIFARTVDYLKLRGVRMLVIAMPEASWNDGVPYEPFYMKQVSDVCMKAGVEIMDLRKALPDDDFADSVHLNPLGIEKFQRAVTPRLLDHLRSTGAVQSGKP
jgi:hypothetical protein